MTKLEKLLSDIAPGRTIEPIGRRVDQAVNSFAFGSGRVVRFQDFTARTIQLIERIEAHILNLRRGLPSASPEMAWGRMVTVLNRAYGAEGVKTAFEISRTGVEKGYYGVCRKVGEVLAEQFAEAEIAARVWGYWNALSADEKLAAGREYVAKYGRQLLPSELRERSAARIRANLPKFLQEHPRQLHRLRQVGR